jgi:hypothetical protein
MVMLTPGCSASKESAAAWSQALDGSVKVIRLREPVRGGADDVVVVVVEVVVVVVVEEVVVDDVLEVEA